MKLSKEEFEEILMEAAHHTANIRGGRCVEIHDAFIDNNLEIEGYERVAWTRLDPKDPKTFPPKGEFLGWFTDIIINDYPFVFDRNDLDTDEAIATRETFKNLTHWRPLPPPPVETEAGK